MDAPAPPPTLADGDFEKESYVPLSFARERVALVTQQMFDMKARHVEAVGELAAQYRQIEEDTREYYVGFIRQLQDKMKVALAQHSNARRQAARELARVQRSERDHAERSKEELGALANEKRKALEGAQAVRQAQETEYAEELKRRETESTQQRSALDETATELASERARAEGLSEALGVARKRNEAAELELQRAAVRRHAVDSTMRALLSSVECECGSEQVRRQQQELRVLQEQLQRAQQDASAFRERVEDERSEMTQVLLERAAAVKEAEDRADAAEKQALVARERAQAQAHAPVQSAASVSTPAATATPTPASAAGSAATARGTMFTAAEAAARGAASAASAAAAATAVSALASAVAQLASASELVSTLTDKVQEQTAALERCEGDKKAKKGEIKKWLKDFKKREGREATREDKEAARPIYEKYQDADRELEQAGAAVRDATSELEAATETESVAAAAVRAAQGAYSPAVQFSDAGGVGARGDADAGGAADSGDDDYEYDTSDVAQLRVDLRAARVGQQELRAQLLALTESIEASAADSGAGGEDVMDEEAQAAYASKVKELEAQHAVETNSLQQELDEARKSAELARKQHEEQQNARTKAQESITAGKDLMIIGAKSQCRTQFEEVAEWLLSSLPRTVGGVEQLEAALKESREQADGPAAKTLRRALDAFATTTAEVEEAAKQLEQATQRADEMKRKLEEHQQEKPAPEAPKPKPRGGARRGPSPAEAAAAARAKAAELQVAELQRELRAADRREKKQRRETTRGGGGGGGGSGGADPAKLRSLQKQAKEDGAKIKQLTAALQKAKAKANAPGTPSGGSQQKAAEQRLAEKEKKHKKAMSEAAKEHERALGAASKKAAKAIKELEQVKKELDETTAARDKLQRKAAALKELQERADELQAKADQVPVLRKELDEQKKSYGSLEGKYKEEQALRKKYHNIIEDMKGKIRVYARCRPMAKYELEKDCSPVVSFRDESTLALTTKRGDRDFTYDAVFSPAHTQADVFEDTRHLCQSAFDGFNVCIFAYGQTGSGKTFTMTGAPGNPGLTPRAIDELFGLMESQKDISRTAVSCYFVELYNEALVDLLWKVDHKGSKEEPPRLDIKKNQKGMVVIKGVTTKPADTAEELLELFDKGNAMRAVGSTKMNAESSRSHSVFGVLLSTYNFTTKKTAVGKLSLVDLAGSERVGKTGATKDRLREAMSINKSLSALGDVISALSTNAKFIPYRNNKLTQLMQDSLGGNAKTLMFVNISPADYNAEETQTSLAYASRVKLITNDAAKNQDNAEITKLKKVIANLKAGGTGELSDDDDDG